MGLEVIGAWGMCVYNFSLFNAVVYPCFQPIIGYIGPFCCWIV